jgi:hypothetical protein
VDAQQQVTATLVSPLVLRSNLAYKRMLVAGMAEVAPKCHVATVTLVPADQPQLLPADPHSQHTKRPSL